VYRRTRASRRYALFDRRVPKSLTGRPVGGKRRRIMSRNFSEIMSGLRRERGLSQRTVAADLHISQALLSHYENGAREPGLPFVCRACDYYGVSADYLLGRSEERSGASREKAFLEDLAVRLRALADLAAGG
jgi:transcriptional regulator with XRE-family HTH domain